MGWAKTEVLLAIFEVEHDSLACRIALPAPCCVPKVRLLQLRQQRLKSAEGVKPRAQSR